MRINRNRLLIISYVCAEAALFLMIKMAEHGDLPTLRYYQLSAIILNTLVTWYYFVGKGNKAEHHENLLVLALSITLIGDVFLTFLGYTRVGILCFCLVQTVYAIYLRTSFPRVIIRGVLFVLLCLVAVFTGQLNDISALGLLNISILAVNAGEGWLSGDERITVLFRIGMTLFFCCDFCIGVRTISSGILNDVSYFLVWTFYIPSQVLLTLNYVIGLEKKGFISEKQ